VFWRRRVLVVLVPLLVWLTWSLTAALTAPGTDTTAARLAEWARNHGLGWAVTTMEKAQYELKKPVVGGTVAGGIPVLGSPAPAPSATHGGSVLAPIRPFVANPLPGEGHWSTITTVRGRPAIETAFLRPDARHTSYLVAAVSMDQDLLRFVLHPGTVVPGGGGWSQPSQITGSQRGSTLATFNSGFRMKDANGGYWADGQSVGQLRKGAASMVITTDGRLDVISWPGGSPGPAVASVRQNLTLLLDKGKVSPLVNDPVTRNWGATIGNAAYVWRSAVGVRADGSVVFVVGPAMSIRTVANLELRAGAVRAMELDINPDWTNFIAYTHPTPSTATPHMIPPDAKPNPSRYLQPSSRDFVAVLGR
jgi:hypothetical protein